MAICGARNGSRFLVILAAVLITRAIAADNNETILNLLQQNPDLGYTFISQLSNLTNSESLAGSDGQARLDTQCILHLHEVQKGLQNKKFWAIKFVDAWGKIPSGIVAGHLIELGDFDECLSISQAITLSTSKLEGKYCLAKMPIGQLNAVPNNINLKIAICVPAACTTEDIDFVLKQFYKILLNLNTEGTDLVSENDCTVRAKKPFEALQWVTVGILSCLALLMTLSTFYDYLATHLKKPTPLNPLLVAFSMRSNMRQLFRTQKYKNAPHIIPCLHGIRCLSIIWIIFGHTYENFTMPLINTFDVLNWYKTAFSMLVLTAVIAVDSFFFLSGLLVSLLALREMDRTKGRLNVLMMYVHRYLRLTPVLAVAILVHMAFYHYMTSGPLWETEVRTMDRCWESWWASLLYVSNYAYPMKICLPHTWYLPIDFQLYLLSPLALYAVWYWKKKGLAAVTVVGVLLSACTFSTIVVNDLSFFGVLTGSDDSWKKYYIPTHTRTAPWIIGFLFGYFLHVNSGKRFTLSKATVLISWLITLCMVSTVLFALYPTVQTGATPMTPLDSAAYVTFSRIGWSMALCWVIFACMNGYGGPANILLSWTFWQPLSKLSYCLYIWHITVQKINVGRRKSGTYFSDYDVILKFWGDFGMTLFVATIMYLAVEAPFCTIEIYFFKSKPKPKTNLVEQGTEREPEPAVDTTKIK